MTQDIDEKQIPFTPGETLEIGVGGDKAGVRLDNYLCMRFGQLSRAKMQRIIKQQDILVNNVKSKPSRKLNPGDTIKLTLPSREIVSQKMDLEILYEDNDVVVVNKMPRVIIHPARGNATGTILNGLYHYASDHFRPDVVHRLDKDTSGVVVFSKNAVANAFLSEQFHNRHTKKKYKAIVWGTPLPSEGIISLPIGDHPDINLQKQAIIEEGKPAKTAYKIEKVMGKFSLLDIEIFTGRMHQIRVHLSHIGCPLICDELYGGANVQSKTISRCALHSYSLTITLPSGIEQTIIAPIPSDMAHFIAQF